MKYYKDPMEIFWRFIAERHCIYKKKEIDKLPPPWTEDRILSNFKFTNVFRELDRGSKFVIDYIIPNTSDDPKSTIFNIIIYRLFNKVETFLAHGAIVYGQYNTDAFHSALRTLWIRGEKVFTNAFIVSGYSMYGRGIDKIQRCSWVLRDIQSDLMANDHQKMNVLVNSDDMEEVYNTLIKLTGLGPFLAYQIAVDISYIPGRYSEDSFVVMGPGAKRGIARLFPEEEIFRHGSGRLCFWLRDNQYEFWDEYGIDYKQLFSDRKEPYQTVMSLENCLCEIQKYMRAYEGSGRPRNTYNQTDGYERMKIDGYSRWG